MNNKQQTEAAELSDMLTMLASQIREASAGEGDLPNPMRLDDWMVDYRSLYSQVRNG